MPTTSVTIILVEAYSSVAISFILILLRVYIRLYVTVGVFKGLSWDDYSIFIAWLFLIAYASFIQVVVNLGFGKHIWELANPANAYQMIKYTIFDQIANVLCCLFTKISITFYVLRIQNERWLRWTLWTPLVFLIMVTITAIFLLAFECVPFKKIWMPETPGTCLHAASVYKLNYLHSAVTILVDLGLSLTPVYLLWGTKIEKGKKTLICILMSLGMIAGISSAIRSSFTNELTSRDFTHDEIPIFAFATTEVCSGVIAACIPTCAALFRRKKFKAERAPGSHATASTSENKSTHQGSISVDDREPQMLQGEDIELEFRQ